MSNGHESVSQSRFVLNRLPWVVCLVALGLYAITLQRSLSLLPDWVSLVPGWTSFLGSPSPAVRAVGWTLPADIFTPAYYLVTLPLRLLPERIVPIAFNLFSALCGALVLAQLARSVALLPHDRTRDQREREESPHALLNFSLSWVPPLLAVLICGLQLTFWEHSTNGTVEMFDLLLFSYVLRSLLEYRIDPKEIRLYRAALVYGIAMTGNMAMTGFLPVFVVALIWSKRLSFFNLRFLGIITSCGLAGLLLYFLLPFVGTMGDTQPFGFWALLKNNLQIQQIMLSVFPKRTLLLFSLTSLLPILLLSIRWASQFGDPSQVGALVTNVVFHLCHVVVLLAGLWVTLEPEFSPRQSGFGFALLPLYYLGALSVGYYSGYILLVSRAIRSRFRPPAPLKLLVQRAATTSIFALLILVPGALAHRNLAQIKLTNGPLQNLVAADLVSGLPKNGIILSDDPRRLWLVQNWLVQHGNKHDYLPLCTAWLKLPEYHKHLKKSHPELASPSKDPEGKSITDLDLIEWMLKLGTNQPITYLHPSFGYYFETFGGEPDGLTLHLKPHTLTNFLAAPWSAPVITQNEKFWAAADSGALRLILPFTTPADPTRKLSFAEQVYKQVKIKPIQNPMARQFGTIYSRSLVCWGVELQKAGDYTNAALRFATARDLNPDNVVAGINLDFNAEHQSGITKKVEVSKSVEDLFGKSRSWEELLTQNGPYDEPSLTYAQGTVFVQGNLLRQAAQCFDRVRTLVPTDLASRLWLAQIQLTARLPDQTLALVKEIREVASRIPGANSNLSDLFTLEASAHFAKNEPAAASKIIESALAATPRNLQLLTASCKTYAENGQYTNALALTDRIIALGEGSPSVWLNKGSFLTELSRFDEAIKAFDQVLALETNNPTALLYRGIASLRGDRLDDAKRDYETVQRQYPKMHQIDYGLGEIAYRRHDTNAAIRHYESYLSNAPPALAEAKVVADRLRELQGLNAKPK